MGVEVTESKIEFGGQSFSNGDKKCGDKEGFVQVLVDGKKHEGDPADIHLEDRRNIVFAFAPKDATIPPTPPSAATLNNLSDMPGSPGATSSTAQVPSETTTSAPGATTTSTPSSTP
jgi:hypothetical protein